MLASDAVNEFRLSSLGCLKLFPWLCYKWRARRWGALAGPGRKGQEAAAKPGAAVAFDRLRK
jgi:hypothetical protein